MLTSRCVHCRRFVSNIFVANVSKLSSVNHTFGQKHFPPFLLGGAANESTPNTSIAFSLSAVKIDPIREPDENRIGEIELPNILDGLNKSISQWKITDPSSKTCEIADPLSSRVGAAVQLPTSESNNGVEKQARIGGKYKRPAFKRMRIKRRQFKKFLRKNRHKIKQREILERNENQRKWEEEFKVIRGEEMVTQSRIKTIKGKQRELVKKIREIIDLNPEIVNEIIEKTDSEFREKLAILNTVEKVSTKEEDLISRIYKRRK